MKALSRKLLAIISTSLLFSATPGIAVAQSSFSGSSTSDDFQSVIEPSETPNSAASLDNSIASEAAPSQAVDGPFAEWGIPTPPGAEGYEVNQVAEEDLNPQELDEWHPTANPNKEIIPGQMRSDREEIPAGVDKVEADKAEVREAQLADPDTPTLNARPGCGVYWPTRFEVCGLIKEKYDSIGGPKSFLLLPKSNELTNPDGVGKRSEFANGFIYWHPKTGAHTVSLPVSVVWARHGWEKGFLGYPTTSDIPQGNDWYKQDFQGGHVYTHNSPIRPSQASIQGAIYDKWQSMGAQNSELGYPISDELTTPDGVGRYNVFEHGMIYWTPQHGAHFVSGLAQYVWADSGYEKGKYGYPVGDSYVNSVEETVQNFEKGQLNLTQTIRDAGDGVVDGKPVSSLLLSFLSLQKKQDFAAYVENMPSLQAGSDNGGVTIPGRYNYDPNAGNLRDYCTKSPDFYYYPGGTSADFRGACARHDICYFDVKESGGASSGFANCNRQLRDNLQTVCRNVYSNEFWIRSDCFFIANSYYEVVVTVHPTHWPGHLGG